ncbi:MAG: diguanylate cyclase protein [Firmicutes bacterium]|nr:diguanylate cyclase protein [Bacillota bacterium]
MVRGESVKMNETAVLMTIDSSILSFVILIIIYFNVYNRQEKVFLQYKLFIGLVQANMALIIIDILGWVFNGLLGKWSLAANTGFNLLLYLVEPMPLMLWILYTDFQVWHDENKIDKMKKWLILVWLINAVPSVMSIETGWLFYVGEDNVYHRGTYYWWHVGYCALLLMYSFCVILFNRKILELRYFRSLMMFFVPQLIGTTIQSFKYGVSYTWSGMMLSLLIIYFNIQDRGLSTDYLTGLYNRRQLDNYMKTKLRKSVNGKNFSAILIDLKDFKQINDKWGHDVGDEALKDAARIIKKCLGNNDLAARFGGDEFFIILEIGDVEALEQVVSQLKNTVSQFNAEGKRAYEINCSIGYAVYDAALQMSPGEFFKHIDMLMYEDKRDSKGVL